MEEEKQQNQHVMSEEEFQDHLHNTLKLITFEGVRKFKSVQRAFRRGNLTNYGYVVPRKPFNHRGNTCKRKGKHSRAMNELKKKMYANYKRYQSRHRESL